MASRSFFGYNPYDYYYTSPHPYPNYHHHHHQPAPARRARGFFPAAADTDAYYHHRPAPARSARGLFPYAADAELDTVRAAARPRAGSSRSVSIPVHFVGSDPEPEREAAELRAEPAARTAAVVPKKPVPSVEAAAVRMQAAARGFLVRRMVRAVREVEREAEEIGTRVAREAEALRGDARVRIAAGEALMQLLLRLDAVRGAREYRKRVTRKVLALQDAVDALEPRPAAAVAEEPETEATTVETAQGLPDVEEGTGEMELRMPAAATGAEMEVDGGSKSVGEQDAADESDPSPGGGANLDGDMPADDGWERAKDEPAPEATACPDAPQPREPTAGGEVRSTAEGGAADGGVDARKVMDMVAALCKRSAQQCAVIGALAERVDALERSLRRVEDAERRRRRAKKLRNLGKGSNHSKC